MWNVGVGQKTKGIVVRNDLTAVSSDGTESDGSKLDLCVGSFIYQDLLNLPDLPSGIRLD